MSTSAQDFLKSFELLPDPEKREVAYELLRRVFVPVEALDDAEVAALYAEFAEEDRDLAEEGIADYESGLVIEDVK
ncbi:MAG TPA: hypothetical protein VJM12_22820 [Pyrinomonadaceae bacterium]|nr:hypothetical protein [Pyrinomonadaceae bacterium]